MFQRLPPSYSTVSIQTEPSAHHLLNGGHHTINSVSGALLNGGRGGGGGLPSVSAGGGGSLYPSAAATLPRYLNGGSHLHSLRFILIFLAINQWTNKKGLDALVRGIKKTTKIQGALTTEVKSQKSKRKLVANFSQWNICTHLYECNSPSALMGARGHDKVVKWENVWSKA